MQFVLRCRVRVVKGQSFSRLRSSVTNVLPSAEPVADGAPALCGLSDDDEATGRVTQQPEAQRTVFVRYFAHLVLRMP